ncbi:MAG: hypothetical protein JOZ90_05030 [Alphaproteobacteria bacterium]|nr:hypothetical protein [Alphaproteobacteria bacterium]MBV9371910.1 hypothetical protein [Alphaproteobacteria bacterium]MBV9900445.1 hypothetical protein [Alphaproteobacteria bacterium]
MFRRLLAAFLIAAPSGAAVAQGESTGDWALATMPNGCMVQATSPKGTMISVWGFAGQDKIAFLLQNRGWSVRDGQPYRLSLDFVGVETLPVSATAREHIDSDGPGFLFSVKPGAQGATGFLNAFTSASGMRITQGTESFDTLPLAGSKTAMAALAQCLADRWSKTPAAAPAADKEKDVLDTV